MALLHPVVRRGLVLKLDRLPLVVRALVQLLLRLQLLVFGLGLPVAQVVLGVVQDLAGLGALGVRVALVTGDDGSVVQEVQEAPAVARQDDLLLCPLDGGEELGIVGLLELLASLTHNTIQSLAL